MEGDWRDNYQTNGTSWHSPDNLLLDLEGIEDITDSRYEFPRSHLNRPGSPFGEFAIRQLTV